MLLRWTCRLSLARTSKCLRSSEHTSHSHFIRVPPRVLNARQTLIICGLGTEAFDNAVKGVLAVHQVLEQRVSPQALQPFSPTSYQDWHTLQFNNRYFTHPSDTCGEEVIQMSADIDPFGIMQKRVQRELHVKDNEVGYFERQSVMEQDKQYV